MKNTVHPLLMPIIGLILHLFQVKRDYIERVGDSLDLVPIGGWHGNGRKAGWFESCAISLLSYCISHRMFI